MKRYLAVLLIAAVLLSGCSAREDNTIQGETPGPGIFPGGSTGAISGTEGRVVKEGDIVMIDYIGSLQNGEIFDTSLERIARNGSYPKSPEFSLRPYYSPLLFSVGTGEVIEGLDEGVKGMKEGEKRRIGVPPEYAYGKWDPENVGYIPWIEEVPLDTEITPSFNMSRVEFLSFFAKEPKQGETLPLLELPWNGTVVEIGEDYVTLNHVLEVGEVFKIDTGPWNVTVIEASAERVAFRSNAVEGEVVEYSPNLPWNTTVVNITEGTITLKHNPFEETTINGVKITPEEDGIKIDQNHPLSGKMLFFDVKLLGIFDPILWRDDLNKAEEEAITENKTIVLYFTTKWCNLCKRLESESLRSPSVLEVKDDFVWVRVDAEEEIDLAEEYGADAYPLLVFLNSNGDEVSRINWFLSGEDLRTELDRVLQIS